MCSARLSSLAIPRDGPTGTWRGMCWAPSCTPFATALRSAWQSISARNCRSSYGVYYYYDQWRPSEQTLKQRSAEQFLDHVSLSHRRPPEC